MSDLEHIVCTIDRGAHGAIRVARETFNGSAPFTDVRFCFKNEAGELKPTAKGTSIRDSEIFLLLDALQKVATRIERGDERRVIPRETRYRPDAQRSLPNTTAPSSAPMTDAERDQDAELF